MNLKIGTLCTPKPGLNGQFYIHIHRSRVTTRVTINRNDILVYLFTIRDRTVSEQELYTFLLGHQLVYLLNGEFIIIQ